MLPSCGPEATPLTIEPMPGPMRPGVVRMSFWITCEKFGVAFDTKNPWQLASGLAEPPLLAAAVPAVANTIVIVARASTFFIALLSLRSGLARARRILAVVHPECTT